jgi:spore maturation protein CgeB
MLHERNPRVVEVFQEGKEAEFFDSYEEMKRKIDFYLSHEAERMQVAQAGRKKVVEGGCLFTDRVRSLVDVYNNLR